MPCNIIFIMVGHSSKYPAQNLIGQNPITTYEMAANYCGIDNGLIMFLKL